MLSFLTNTSFIGIIIIISYLYILLVFYDVVYQILHYFNTYQQYQDNRYNENPTSKKQLNMTNTKRAGNIN